MDKYVGCSEIHQMKPSDIDSILLFHKDFTAIHA